MSYQRPTSYVRSRPVEGQDHVSYFHTLPQLDDSRLHTPNEIAEHEPELNLETVRYPSPAQTRPFPLLLYPTLSDLDSSSLDSDGVFNAERFAA